MHKLSQIRQNIRAAHLKEEQKIIEPMQQALAAQSQLRTRSSARAAKLVEAIRGDAHPGIMEVFLAEYGLSTDEGVALMCLAEALLRVPDAHTMDALIEDKIAPSKWDAHLGHSTSSLVNASTWALMLTGRVLNDYPKPGLTHTLKSMVKRLGEPVIRTAVMRAMKEMGKQFVLGETIDAAMKRATTREKEGYTYSYDMLGEAALTEADAQTYHQAYADAIKQIARNTKFGDVRKNPGISVKLSALYPRYEENQRDSVLEHLVPRLQTLLRQACRAGIGLNIDAEEADRLDLSLDVIEKAIQDPELAGWDGFGIVVQAYGKRAALVIDWLYALAQKHERRLMIRLVKGAYWDTEIKRSQVEGLEDFPVFSRKAHTDISYLNCAQKLLGMTDHIYPQFATHNAHSVASILEMAQAHSSDVYEFQRLHGMGASLYSCVKKTQKIACRIYAPVGAHRDLLAYLVRRLLENGANSSFVNQIVDTSIPATEVGRDPLTLDDLGTANPVVEAPEALFMPQRRNSKGFDWHDRECIKEMEEARAPFADTKWRAGAMGAAAFGEGKAVDIINPAIPNDIVGQVFEAQRTDVDAALSAAQPWQASVNERAEILTKVSDLFEEHYGELFALLAREAGKTLPDAIAELREAVDFLRYYAQEAKKHPNPPRGTFACISPWNFPLAIFTGQISAALAVGNAVIAKPAETTPLIAARAISFFYEAGVPETALMLLPGTGMEIGQALSSDPRVGGMAFTGSTATGQRINRAMAEHLAPDAPLIAETGGLNAMIVDSTALPEQAIRDIIVSAFQSAGQRCSALRVLYLQEDIAEGFLKMLYGAMSCLRMGRPWDLTTDIGPVIDQRAKEGIDAHVAQAVAENRLLFLLDAPQEGHFAAPTVLKIKGIADLKQEIFGPILHIATFKSRDLSKIVDDINATGFGLTFGMHSRIDDRVELVTSQISAGNIYINRNQIGAIVGSQPFGGQGLSGTGPKAGGPRYLTRFVRGESPQTAEPRPEKAPAPSIDMVQRMIARQKTAYDIRDSQALPGPTGESNHLMTLARGTILCLGPTPEDARAQAAQAQDAGCSAILIAAGAEGDNCIAAALPPQVLTQLQGFDGVSFWGVESEARALRQALAAREGALIPLFCDADIRLRCILERHLCINTTAAGGNAQLLAAVS